LLKTISWISKCIKHVGFIKMKDHFVVSMASTSVSNSAKRSGSFSEEEEQLFVSLVAQNKHIVEN
jgi:hypothetical protein